MKIFSLRDASSRDTLGLVLPSDPSRYIDSIWIKINGVNRYSLKVTGVEIDGSRMQLAFASCAIGNKKAPVKGLSYMQ